MGMYDSEFSLLTQAHSQLEVFRPCYWIYLLTYHLYQPSCGNESCTQRCRPPCWRQCPRLPLEAVRIKVEFSIIALSSCYLWQTYWHDTRAIVQFPLQLEESDVRVMEVLAVRVDFSHFEPFIWTWTGQISKKSTPSLTLGTWTVWCIWSPGRCRYRRRSPPPLRGYSRSCRRRHRSGLWWPTRETVRPLDTDIVTDILIEIHQIILPLTCALGVEGGVGHVHLHNCQPRPHLRYVGRVLLL